MERHEKIAKYVEAIFIYGFLTLCYLMDEYEQAENFEECGIIVDALREANKNHNLNLPTKFDDNAIKYFRKAMNEVGLTGDTIITNLPDYAEKVIELVNSEGHE